MIPTLSYGEISKPVILSIRPFLGPNTVAMPDCRSNNVKPKDEDVVLVVRVVVQPNFNPATAIRNVKYQVPTADETAEDEQDNGTDNIYQGDTTNPYPFHVDLTEITPAGNKYAAIRIVLRDPNNYTFYDEPDRSGKRGIHGVGYSKPNYPPYNPLGFCGAHLETKKFTSAVFYVKMKAKTGKKYELGSFNFGLVPVRPNDTPIFVDPKVSNNG
jgi:hypothetical protein